MSRSQALWAVAVAGSLAALGVAPESAAQDKGPDAAVAAPEQDPTLEEAKSLFRKGNALRAAGQLDSALDMFLRSRQLVPSVPNTLNAAVTLDDLGRSDEAQELYEVLLAEFGARLTGEERSGVTSSLARLRQKVGAIDVAANVEGVLVIDGRKRGTLPLTKPVRLMPGTHLVRVMREGYVPAEARIEVQPGKTASLDLRLEVLASAGRLRVEAPSGTSEELEVLVDGAPVGTAPWEGSLAPGRHLVALRGKDLGTAPTAASVVVGQTVPLKLRALPLGPRLRLIPAPLGANLSLDGTSLGTGVWEGRLPSGKHLVQASEEGYLPASLELNASSAGDHPVRLVLDRSHPRWIQQVKASFRIDLLGSYAMASSLGSGAEEACPGSCSQRSGPSGWMGGLRGSYVLPSGLGLELTTGYLRVATSFQRRIEHDATVAYHLSDDLAISGPFAGVGASYGIRAGGPVWIVGRLMAGAMLTRARDELSGTASRGTESIQVRVLDSGKAVSGVDLFAIPELGAELRLGRFHLGAALGVGLFAVEGSRSSQGEIRPVDTSRCSAAGTELECLRGSEAVTGERAYGRFLVLLPQLNAGMTF